MEMRSHRDRRTDLERFYAILARLTEIVGGARELSACTGRMEWPVRGVYFFQEPGEVRSDTGSGLRIVRVGTHALKAGSRTTLWNRLSQHKGQAKSGGGNHRGSIFRLIVGSALMGTNRLCVQTWGSGSSAPRNIREAEQPLEKLVSETIGCMPFLWLKIDDAPGPDSLRGYIERNAIALLSNSGKTPLDPPSQEWLGRQCDRKRVRDSGLWNQNHVDESYDCAFLDELSSLVSAMGARR